MLIIRSRQSIADAFVSIVINGKLQESCECCYLPLLHLSATLLPPLCDFFLKKIMQHAIQTQILGYSGEGKQIFQAFSYT